MTAGSSFDVAALRSEFPGLSVTSRGRPLVYLDNAATTHKPQVVIDAVVGYYRDYNANIHRGVYESSERATLAYDGARPTVAKFLGGVREDEIVFTYGTTDGTNLIAQSWLRPRVKGDTVVLVSETEHHANIVPWQMAGARTVAIPVNDRGELDLDAARRLLAEGPVLLAIGQVSNAIGIVHPVEELCRMAREVGVPVLIDGAQAVSHFPVDLTTLGCDFYVFSGHKLFGPTGTGVLWAKREHLRKMPPYRGGGDMIDLVDFAGTTYAAAPQRFEAGTPHIAGVIGMGAAIRWLMDQDRAAMTAHEHELYLAGAAMLDAMPGITRFGTGEHNAGVLTFAMDGAHPHDIASVLDAEGICVRAGHHCAQPLHRRFGQVATVRASIAAYNTADEVEALGRGIERVREIFG
jgi:cysteine desulfurase/selenocysteine lyase